MLMATLPGPSNNCPAGPATPETTVASSDIACKLFYINWTDARHRGGEPERVDDMQTLYSYDKDMYG